MASLLLSNPPEQGGRLVPASRHSVGTSTVVRRRKVGGVPARPTAARNARLSARPPSKWSSVLQGPGAVPASLRNRVAARSNYYGQGSCVGRGDIVHGDQVVRPSAVGAPNGDRRVSDTSAVVDVAAGSGAGAGAGAGGGADAGATATSTASAMRAKDRFDPEVAQFGPVAEKLDSTEPSAHFRMYKDDDSGRVVDGTHSEGAHAKARAGDFHRDLLSKAPSTPAEGAWRSSHPVTVRTVFTEPVKRVSRPAPGGSPPVSPPVLPPLSPVRKRLSNLRVSPMVASTNPSVPLASPPRSVCSDDACACHCSCDSCDEKFFGSDSDGSEPAWDDAHKPVHYETRADVMSEREASRYLHSCSEIGVLSESAGLMLDPMFSDARRVDLSSSGLGLRFFQSVHSSMRATATVTHLNLAGNRVDDACVKLLVAALPPNLTALNLARNAITRVGCDAIADALPSKAWGVSQLVSVSLLLVACCLLLAACCLLLVARCSLLVACLLVACWLVAVAAAVVVPVCR